MELKEILKPSTEKLVIALILFLFMPVFPYTIDCVCNTGFMENCPCPIKGHASAIGMVFGSPFNLSSSFDQPEISNLEFSFIPLIGIAIAYVLACIAMLAYQKVQKK